MALPKLNSSPKYELTIPSNGEKVRFRPFLVKEQKVLLLAYESQDKKQIIQAIVDTIESCVDEDVDAFKLATFDVDYIFTQIRAKSVGEIVDLQISCESCQTPNDVNVNLEKIDVEVPDRDQIIELTDQISVKMGYPDYGRLMLNGNIFEAQNASEVVMEVILSSIESIMTEEENILARDETRQDLVDFIDSMTSEQFKKISDYVEYMPVMKQEVEFTCVNCSHDNSRVLQGIDDFF